MNSMEYTTPDTFPHPLITYQCWLTVLTIRFSLKAACHANPGAQRN